jgi:hypothetical protein
MVLRKLDDDTVTVTVAVAATGTDSWEETVQLVVPLHRVMPGRGRVQKQAAMAMAALQWTLTARENHSSLATASTTAATSRRRRRRRVLGVGIVDEGPRAVHGQR